MVINFRTNGLKAKRVYLLIKNIYLRYKTKTNILKLNVFKYGTDFNDPDLFFNFKNLTDNDNFKVFFKTDFKNLNINI